MQVNLLPARQLTPDLCGQWSAIQRLNPALASPYFRPEFTQTVAEVRSDVEVAVIENGGGVVGFFPFQRQGRSYGQPVAGRLSDFHGLIVPADFQCDPLQLLPQCGLRSWRFDHLIPSQTMFADHVWTKASSPYIDVSAGFAAYEAQRKAENSALSSIKRNLKKIAREVGPLRLEWSCSKSESLQTLLRWKSDQYQRTGSCDVFSFPWIREFFDRLLERREPALRGLVTCLYAGDQLVAAHLGMSSEHMLHWWFPSYDRQLSRYSPGLGLIYTMAQYAKQQGVTRIDFGKGDEQYKFRLASGVDQVGEGCVDVRPSTRLLRKTWQTTRDWVRSSVLRRPTQLPLRWFRRIRG